MRVCVDTNLLLQLFGRSRPYGRLTDALQHGRLGLAVSTEILLEYEETVTHLSGRDRWQVVEVFLHGISKLHGTVLYVEPHFRFSVITADPDDNKFVDCAIAAEVDFILTSDRHFDVLHASGYKPRPINPDEFITNHL
jgi:putative PIN family toxin of toxin-antitoxin system